jgi:single-strand DNA-binding protein
MSECGEVNRTLLSGYLACDSELRELSGGEPVCILRLACTSTCGGQTGYFNVIVLGPSVPVYLHKGQEVLIQGSLESTRWEAGEGPEREAVAVLAEHVDLVGIR